MVKEMTPREKILRDALKEAETRISFLVSRENPRIKGDSVWFIKQALKQADAVKDGPKEKIQRNLAI